MRGSSGHNDPCSSQPKLHSQECQTRQIAHLTGKMLDIYIPISLSTGGQFSCPWNDVYVAPAFKVTNQKCTGQTYTMPIAKGILDSGAMSTSTKNVDVGEQVVGFPRASLLTVESPAMANCFIFVWTGRKEMQDESITGHHLEASSSSKIRQEGHQPIITCTAQKDELQEFPHSSHRPSLYRQTLLSKEEQRVMKRCQQKQEVRMSMSERKW